MSAFARTPGSEGRHLPWVPVLLALLVPVGQPPAGAAEAAAAGPDKPGPAARNVPAGPGRGFPEPGPWVSFYGSAAKAGSLSELAQRFRIFNIDADPGIGNFSPQDIATLKAGGRNRVVSYMNVGACEAFREYHKQVPPGFVSCKANLRAQRGRYDGYPDETWMDVSNPDYQKLIVEHVAVRLARAGVDGFYLDNLEIVEHGERTTNGPCGDRCRQGGLELVARLRAAFPQHLIVMQNATSDVTRLGKTELGPYPELLDGVAHESVFAPELDSQALEQMKAWKAMNLRPGGRPFFLGVEDYVGSCKATAKAAGVYRLIREQGFSPYVADASAGQQVICRWSFDTPGRRGPGRRLAQPKPKNPSP